MNKSQKIIWSAYIVGIIILAINDANSYSDTAVSFFIVGWIPALILSVMWKDKK